MASKWGDPRADQIEVSARGDWSEPARRPARKLFGVTLRPARIVMVKKYGDIPARHITDDRDECKRVFRFRCGLIKAINVVGEKSTYLLYLEGYHNIQIPADAVRFDFNPEAESCHSLATIVFTGWGTRHGALRGYQVHSVDLQFRDEQQLREHLVAVPASTPRPEKSAPQQIRHIHQSGSDVWPFVAGLALGIAID